MLEKSLHVLVVLYFCICVKSTVLKHNTDDSKNAVESSMMKSSSQKDNINPAKKVLPREDLAQKAYGDPGEKWKVLGYSETTGYPIIDLSSLGINSEASTKKSKVAETPSNNSPTEILDKPKPRPLSYSEMKGAGRTKQSLPTKKNMNLIKQFNAFTWELFKNKRRDPKKTVKSLHLKLHRTHSTRHHTVRSILYPHLSPPKYRIISKKKRVWDFFTKRKFESKGKYDFRHLDVEKLMDIVVQDAALLVFKYIRDLPTVPVIYECKVSIMFPLFKILGHLNEIERYLGIPATTVGYPRRRAVLFSLLSTMIRWLLNIKTVRNTIHGPAKNVEHDITMMQRDYSQYSNQDCEGEMDEKDQRQFNMDYNFLLDLDRNAYERHKKDKLSTKLKSGIKNKLLGQKSDSST